MKLTKFKKRRQKFDDLLKRIKDDERKLLVDFDRVTCPACGYPTLSGHQYEMCILCDWEDDFQDDANADEVWGGPNGDYSLTEARVNFEKSCGKGGMYRSEDEVDFQRVQNRYPHTRQLIKAYERLIQTETLEELALKIQKIREADG